MFSRVRTTMNFLAREELYKYEKPYLLIFEPPEGFPRTNIRLDKRKDVILEDIRGREDKFSLAQHGFQLLKIESSLRAQDFEDDQQVTSTYLPEVAEALRKLLNASRVQVFEHLLRKTHEIFPVSTGEPYKYNQPTSIAHIDITTEGTEAMVNQLNTDNAAELLNNGVLCVNVWKPLSEPVLDWPLGLCDARSVELKDLCPGDLVYDDYAVENLQVHYNADQKWYFTSEQTADEAWVFVQSSCGANVARGGYTPHSSFPMPMGDKSYRRESIETRCLVYM
ncbi:hypothetical protein PVAG01_00313 [Phlyctema vagabunda]|uniref:Uncharacterized protein n=1 Tax=Phlyctema vagabunda TaxID=108571 RepID=A0ABR4PU61_9HELO